MTLAQPGFRPIDDGFPGEALQWVTTPEHELLLRILGRHATPAHVWESLAGRVNWNRFVTVAGRRILSYAEYRLTQCPAWPGVPASVRRALTEARRRDAMTHLQRHHTLRRVVAAFESGRIPVVALKGFPLGHLVYPDPTLRPMADVDLWVPESHGDEAATVLVELGLRIPDWRTIGASAEAPREATERTYVHPDSLVTIELHTPPVSLTRLGTNRLDLAWNRTVPLSAAGMTIRTLHPEDLLVHLCLHARKSFGSSLQSLLDIHLVVEKWVEDWNWLEMADEYSAAGIDAAMYLALRVARDMLGASVPARFFERVPAPKHIDELRPLAARAFLESGDGHLPVLLRSLAQSASTGAQGLSFVDRLTSYYWPKHGAPRSTIGRLRDAAQRLRYDLTVKVPRYVRLWGEGTLRVGEVRRRTALARDRLRIAQLLAECERPAEADG